jgi:hypothetical protein
MRLKTRGLRMGVFLEMERRTWHFCDVAIHGSEFMVLFLYATGGA